MSLFRFVLLHADPRGHSPPHRRGCTRCVGAEVYEKSPCVSTQDTACASCTVCRERQVQACDCGVINSACYTGDRVCYDLVPVAMNLTVVLRSQARLSASQQALVSIGMQTGYIEWLNFTFVVGGIQFNSMVPTPNQTYTVSYTLTDVYDRYTIERLIAGDAALFTLGVTYTFGGGTLSRRRLLAATQDPRAYVADLVTAVGAGSTCQATGSCPRFFNNTPQDANACDNVCVPLPCPPGYTGDFGLCTLCPNATYKAVAGNDTCTRCPDGFTSPQGITNGSECVWDPYWALTSTTPRPLATSTFRSSATTTTTAAAAATSSSSASTQTSTAVRSSSTLAVPTTAVGTTAPASSPATTAGQAGVPSTATFQAQRLSTVASTTTGPEATAPPSPSVAQPPDSVWTLVLFLKDLLIVMIVLFCIAMCLLLSLCFWVVYGRQMRPASHRRVGPADDAYPVVRYRMDPRQDRVE